MDEKSIKVVKDFAFKIAKINPDLSWNSALKLAKNHGLCDPVSLVQAQAELGLVTVENLFDEVISGFSAIPIELDMSESTSIENRMFMVDPRPLYNRLPTNKDRDYITARELVDQLLVMFDADPTVEDFRITISRPVCRSTVSARILVDATTITISSSDESFSITID